MIRAVIFDYGGVLVDNVSHPAHLGAVAQQFGVTPAALKTAVYGEHNALWNLTKVGAQGEAQHWETVARRLGVSLADALAIRDRWFGDAPVRNDFLDYVRTLRGRYALGLLSNALPSFEATWRRLGLYDLFDVLLNSGVEGLAKPDPAFYALLLRRLKLPAEACLFVDDQRKNTDAAAALGFRVVQYLDAAQARADIERQLAESG